MIRIGPYDVDPARGTFERRRPERKTPSQIMAEVKLKRADLVRAHKVTDAELQNMIVKVLSGTRNVHYLCDQYLAAGQSVNNYGRLKDIAAYIVREYSYG